MKTKLKKIPTKLSLFIFVILLMASTSVRPAYAFDLTSISTGQIQNIALAVLKYLMGSFGVNQPALKSEIQTANVAQNKQTPPQVSLSFDPADPVPNQEATALATPSYFLNDTNNLYFTWYIQHHNGDGIKSRYDQTLGKNIDCDGQGNCDLNGDGSIDIEDYKIAAMRMIASNDFDWQNANYSKQTDHAGYQSIYGGNDQGGKNTYCFVYDDVSGNEYQLKGGNGGCTKHLFPDTNGRGIVGDKHWGLDEEKFWHTDPNSDDTAYTGNPDEANVAGLGIDQFTWVYEPGDRVGVAVEGTAISPTQTYDSSYRTMWAFPKNNCDLSQFISNIDKTTGSGDTLQFVHKPNSTVDVTVDDINNTCLTDNLIDPAQGGGEAQRLDVNLSYSPQNPMNDPAMQNGDEVTVSSSISNMDDTNPDYFQYQWQVYGSNDPNPDSWGNPIGLSNSDTQDPNATPATGLGLDSFSFNLDFQNPPEKYMLVKLTVTQNVSNGITRKGIGTVVMPISSTDDQISAYSTTVADGTPPQISLNTDSQLCTDAADAAICPVAQDSIIGVEVPQGKLTDFLWTVNGDPVTLVNGSTTQSNVAYFPILDDSGTQYDINLAATDITTGDKVNLTKVFEVADPAATIASVNNNILQPVLLGYYVDLNGKLWPDYSDQNFQGLTGTNLKLEANFDGFAPPAGAYTWYVNNALAGSTDDTTGSSVDQNGILSLPSGTTDNSYDVDVSAMYYPNIATQKALNYYWSVPITEFYSTPVGASVQINLADSLSGQTSAQAKTPPQKILASLYTSLPSYLAFLFRVVLTIFVILFTSGLILSFSAPSEKD
ncbi:MAG: hypothetical protein P4L62_00295 [Candidatus Pacebacteria bacterium]|nr:hypothetical protein [Candidatus Paceibacterota bacterium]MDR3582789.1 hypothetical protein [Candidatus Paceibacterota bacterium]